MAMMVIAMVMLAKTMLVTLSTSTPGKPQRGGPLPHHDDNDDTDGDDGEEHGADSESHLNRLRSAATGWLSPPR